MKTLSPYIAFAVSILTLIGFVTGWFVTVQQRVSSWLRADPVVIIRDEQIKETDDWAEYRLTFSVANRQDVPITLNSVELRLGDYAYGSPNPLLFYLAFRHYHADISITFVGHENTPFPKIREEASANSMGFAVFQLLNERGALGSHEQIDFSVFVELSRPSELKGKYLDLWSLGATVTVEYENRELRKRRIGYARTDHRRAERMDHPGSIPVYVDRWHLSPRSARHPGIPR